MPPTRALEYARQHRSRFLSELKHFLSFRSISSQARYKSEIERCAQWLGDHLRSIGMEHISLLRPGRSRVGNPIVYASWRHAPGRPTILVYGHYDVLPGEPLEEWESDPFNPIVKAGSLYGRGSSDDKGQLFCHVKAIEALLSTGRRLPVNVKCLFEGEEEIGSPHLAAFIQRNRSALAADVALISDTRMIGPHQPAISYAQRGGLRVDIAIHGPAQELHSGTFGGAVHNPVQALCELIAGLHDDQGRVTVPGFYKGVRDWSAQERLYMARTGPANETIRQDARVRQTWGEVGYNLYERTTIRPALTVNGICGGYSGPGHKAIIPSCARAKLSLRLVPDQNPRLIADALRAWIVEQAPATVQAEVRTTSLVMPVIMNRNQPAMGVASLAYQKGFGALPVFLRSGGSIPVIRTFQKSLSVPVVLMGFGLPDDRIHAPNEKFNLEVFARAINTCIWFLTKSTHLGPAGVGTVNVHGMASD